MRLADFIEQNVADIVEGAAVFARTLAPTGISLDTAELRDHLPQVLAAIVLDLRTAQTAAQQQAKSEGRSPTSPGRESAASSHGRLRAQSGFDINRMVAEYRALRAAVIRLWAADERLAAGSIDDMIRFNEAIDQAVAESVAEFSREVESWRQVFLGALGHDLRGPLSVVLCNAEVLAMAELDSQPANQVARIVRGAAHMRALLDELLDYSKSQLGMEMALRRSPCDLAEELRDEVDSLRTILPNASLKFIADGPVEGEFDCVRVREAIHNLVANAAKYGDLASDVVVAVRAGVKQVRITVTNSGQPLSDGFLGSMFDPLRRGPQEAAAGEHSSLGLGLFIVREIAQAHGGDVAATCADGQTQFVITLPLRPACAAESSGSGPTRARHGAGGAADGA
ncbi:MAG TPA: sensor histidine kinase [Lysobacter sp.]